MSYQEHPLQPHVVPGSRGQSPWIRDLARLGGPWIQGLWPLDSLDPYRGDGDSSPSPLRGSARN